LELSDESLLCGRRLRALGGAPWLHKSSTETTTVPLEQDQFDVLTSFVFNVGSGAFRESTLLKLLNQGKYDEVPEQLDRWVKAGAARFRVLSRGARRRESSSHAAPSSRPMTEP
jgi:GH24 family phage-related lysozyme (muramidase)